ERAKRTERDVDAYGLLQRGGAWFLTGHCLLRGGVRTFHLDRVVSLLVNAEKPRTADFSPPRDFDLAEVATRPAWEYQVHSPIRCKVRLEHPVAEEARGSFGPRAKVSEGRKAATVEVSATNGEALLRHVLSLGE